MKYFWICDGNAFSEHDLARATEQSKNLILNGIHVIEHQAYEDIRKKLEIAVEALDSSIYALGLAEKAFGGGFHSSTSAVASQSVIRNLEFIKEALAKIRLP